MARTADAAGMLDIRSAAIFEDVVYASSNCAPGTSELKRHRYYGAALFQDLPLDADPRNPNKYDRFKDWIKAFCSFAICLTIFGIIHSMPLTHPRAVRKYNMGFLEITVFASATYAIMMLFGPLAACMIRAVGHRLTCIFGMLLFFVGLLLDAMEIQQIVYYLAHLILMGFGACFAITAATSAVVDHFRLHLAFALTFLSCAAPIGTILFFVLHYFLTVYTPIEYKWKMITFALLVLILIAATHALPSSIRVLKHPNPFYKKKTKHRAVTDCIGEATLAEEQARECDPDYRPRPYDQKPCLCVCVCDVSILTDLSFLLWAGVSCCAMFTVYVPYLLIVPYAAEDNQIEYWDAIWLIIWYCVASILFRMAIMLGNDHTLIYNRSVFQIAIIASGFLYYFITYATTYGWLLCWCLVMGAIEGLIISSIPRVTLQTIPRKHMVCSWSYIVVFHGFAIIIGPYLFAMARSSDSGNLYIACLAVGLAQIIAGLLAFLLPDEEDGEPPEEIEPTPNPANHSVSASRAHFSGTDLGRYPAASYRPPTQRMRIGATAGLGHGVGSDCRCPTYSSISGRYKPIISRGKDCCKLGNHDYLCNCPICAEVGCIPGCTPCTPGGLTDGSILPMFVDVGPAQPCCGPSNVTTGTQHPVPPSNTANYGPAPSAPPLVQTAHPPPPPPPVAGSSTGGTVKRTELEIRHTKTPPARK